MNNEDRERRQMKLASLFFEMGMDLNLVEKMSGVSKETILNKEIYDKCKEVPLTFNNYDSTMYIEK